MNSIQTSGYFRVTQRATQQGTYPNRVVIDKRYMGEFYSPVYALDLAELPELIRALQSFAMSKGKGD